MQGLTPVDNVLPCLLCPMAQAPNGVMPDGARPVFSINCDQPEILCPPCKSCAGDPEGAAPCPVAGCWRRAGDRSGYPGEALRAEVAPE